MSGWCFWWILKYTFYNFSLGILENIQIELDTVATLMKLIYAFLWQEYVLTGADIFLDPEVNVLGAAFMSTVNGIANYLNSFPVLDEPLQSGYGIYPGKKKIIEII